MDVPGRAGSRLVGPLLYVVSEEPGVLLAWVSHVPILSRGWFSLRPGMPRSPPVVWVSPRRPTVRLGKDRITSIRREVMPHVPLSRFALLFIRADSPAILQAGKRFESLCESGRLFLFPHLTFSAKRWILD